MPGRPRTTLKRLNDLLHLAEGYGSKLYALMPARYHEQPDTNDQVCMAWRQAAQAAVENYRALDVLRDHVARKVERAEKQKSIMEADRG